MQFRALMSVLYSPATCLLFLVMVVQWYRDAEPCHQQNYRLCGTSVNNQLASGEHARLLCEHFILVQNERSLQDVATKHLMKIHKFLFCTKFYDVQQIF